MRFAEELYVGKSIEDTAAVVSLMEMGITAPGVFCVCVRDNGRFSYEIMSAGQLLTERNAGKYTVIGVAGGKREAFELLRFILEDTNAY